MTAQKKEMAALIIRNSLAYQCEQIRVFPGDDAIKIYPASGDTWGQAKLTAALDLAEIRTYVDYDHVKQQCFLQIY